MAKTILIALVSFIVGAVVVFLICAAVSAIRRKGRKPARHGGGMHKPPRKKLTKPKTSTVVLVFVAVYVIWFTHRMIGLYELTGGIPDTLVTCVFGICGGECGALSWIRTSKEKYRDRKWSLDDERRMNEAAKKAADDMEPSFTAERRNDK